MFDDMEEEDECYGMSDEMGAQKSDNSENDDKKIKAVMNDFLKGMDAQRRNSNGSDKVILDDSDE